MALYTLNLEEDIDMTQSLTMPTVLVLCNLMQYAGMEFHEEEVGNFHIRCGTIEWIKARDELVKTGWLTKDE